MFFSYRTTFSTIFLLFLCAAPAAQSEEAFYLGGGVLSDKNDFKVFWGEKTSEALSGDLQYIDFGELTLGNDMVDAQSLGYNLLFKKTVFSKAQVFLKLGIHYWEADVTTSSSKYAKSGTDGYAGAGINFHITGDWFARAEYEKFKFKLDPAGELDVDLSSLTFIRKF